MSSMLLLEAIGYLDEDLLERSEKKQEPKKYAWVGWTALAACVCLVCAGAWGIFNPVKTNDSAAPEAMHSANTILDSDTKEPGKMNQYFEDFSGAITDKVYGALAVRFIRTGGFSRKDPSPAVAVNNRQQLEEYIAANDVIFASTNFAEECRKYDDAFFEKTQLVILALDGVSGSVSHELVDITDTQKAWNVRIGRHYPKKITKDLAFWHVLIEVEAGLIGENDRITIQYLDKTEEE